MRRQFFERLSWIDLFLWVLRIGVIALIVYGSIRSLQMAKYSPETWLSLIIAGLAQGSIYALIAIGYTLVYGVLLMINFAHGEVYMAGAFTSTLVAEALAQYALAERYPLPMLALLLFVSMIVSGGVAVILERVAYRPLRGSPRLVPLITAIGASFALQYIFRGLYGSAFHTYPEFGRMWGQMTIGGATIQIVQVVVFVAAVLMMFGLWLFVERTKTGKSLRAVSEDKEIAALMGINVDHVIMITFALGGILAGAAGVARGLYQPQGIWFFMGFLPGLKAFTAAVLGGIGSIPGAMLGGLFLGIFESVGPNLFLEGLGVPAAYQLKDVIAFTMLVLVLMFRPQGIMGEKLAEKKA
ncbi:MAG: branched-chain amino acid ABC transporter permease [Anaerolineales bacterium]|nr:branched-chain amino acid ABC transporter permease [Anaerolineales bacterium]